MPYVNIKITREGGPDGTGASSEDKGRLIAGVTDLLKRVLGKDPSTTFVVIDEVDLDNWGISGVSVKVSRSGSG